MDKTRHPPDPGRNLTRVSDFFSADLDADLAIATVEQQIADAQERAERAAELRRQIDAVRGVATSPRREVTVTVDAAGRLAAVELTDAASHLPSRDLGRLIVHTANEAQRRAGEKALELASEAFGADSPTVAHLRGELDRPAPSADTTIAI
ncbi:hypothetical protein RR49_01536 [Microbacterium ginsengisoli]|uniref:Nucleoid-associated protein YbaB n=1 Tax=Microbacterium ginsengisoli TaxID=400772 RepID=A0A0F0LYQ6_9MICO|nr:hypothetical protein RR49_01536 [Microbacterium ginsengisoli]